MEEQVEIMTYRELKEMLANLTDGQLDEKVRWWGDERGGTVKSWQPLDDEYVHSDEGFIPLSTIDPRDLDGYEGETRIPKGTPILYVD